MLENELVSSNLEKYDINNFYIGELTITEAIDNSTVEHKHLSRTGKYLTLIKNGAIDLGINTIYNHNDWRKRIKNYKVLTVFYKCDKGYICLHNGTIYNLTSIDFCHNLTNLSSLLPKLSFEIPKKLSIKQSLFIFDQLFKKTLPLEKIYNTKKYEVTNFYTGTLVLPTEFIPQNKIIPKEQLNIPTKYILSKNAKYKLMSSNTLTEDHPNELSLPLGRYVHTHYKCLFLKLPNGYYNINNFQIYTKGTSEKFTREERPIGESYYEQLTPITDIINKHDSSKMSIPKLLLKLQS